MSDLVLKGFKTFHSFDDLQQLFNNEKIKALKQNPKVPSRILCNVR
ncbi:hypothetical protein [Parageobacillus toebii]|nr:hypothetical protein [Parageobacillus toebii]WMT18189.1 hypothetical protein RFB12_12835 [Parageobacillus toebii]